MTTPKPAALPEFIRVLVRVQGGESHSTEAQFMSDEIGYLVCVPREWQPAALQAQPADVSDAGAPFGMLRTTCPYCEQGFAFDRPEADASDELVDQHLDAILRAAGSALRHYTTQKSKDDMRAALLLAILALLPQSESEARRAAQEQLYTERERHTAEVKRLQAEIGRLQSLRPQAVPMTPAERERGLDRSPVDVSWEAGDAFMEGIYAAEAHHGITAQGAQGEQG